MFSKGSKNKWALFILMLAGLVGFGFIGMYLSEFKYTGWLNLGASFGVDPPFVLNLGLIALSFGVNVRFTIAGILGVITAVVLYKKL